MRQRHENTKPWLLLLVLGLSATGCATTSQTPSVICPVLPPAPALSEPIPSVDYSISAQQRIKSWRDKLTVTPGTP